MERWVTWDPLGGSGGVRGLCSAGGLGGYQAISHPKKIVSSLLNFVFSQILFTMSKDDRVTEGAASPFVDRKFIKRESKSPDSRYPHNIKSESITELIATTAARSQAIYSQEGTAEIVWIDWWDFRSHEGANVSCSGFLTDQAEQLIERVNRARSAVLPLPLMSRTEPAALALPQCLGYILKCECVE